MCRQFVRFVNHDDYQCKLQLTYDKTASPTTGTASSPDGKSGSSIGNINGEIYVAEGDFIKDIEVNDLRNRYTLTKGSTQKMVNMPCHLH